MTVSTSIRKAGRKIAKTEARIARVAAPRAGSAPEQVVATIGKLGDQPELRTLAAVVLAGGLLGANRRLLRTGIRMLLAHELATLGKDLIKGRIDRTRPHSAESRSDRAVKPGRNTAKSKTSFPSGHSAGSVAVARAVGREYPQLQAPALAAAAIVGGLQVPRLAHYPSDVAAGMIVGAAAEAAAGLILPRGGDDS